MSFVTTSDGTEIFYKDWGTGRPVVFHHGWPLSADDWDAQMMFFLEQGLPGDRARPSRPRPFDADGCGQRHGHVRRRRGGSWPTPRSAGAIHVGHSTGGGEVARYVAARQRSGSRRRC